MYNIPWRTHPYPNLAYIDTRFISCSQKTFLYPASCTRLRVVIVDERKQVLSQLTMLN